MLQSSVFVNNKIQAVRLPVEARFGYQLKTGYYGARLNHSS
ncbi:MAG: hypothetical protein Q9M50_07620 [Methylococcales bacterium]|nr:hypothetical protein [Methylococcales bacterium]